jgi:hypothetical protein
MQDRSDSPDRHGVAHESLAASHRHRVILLFKPIHAAILRLTRMNVFSEYKPVRNKIALLSVEEALATIWAYAQYLQVDGFGFPSEIEVQKDFLSLDFPRSWISE